MFEKIEVKDKHLFLTPNKFDKKLPLLIMSHGSGGISDIDIDFSSQRELLKDNFKAFHSLASQTDKSFLGAVEAQEKKQLKGLDNLEKRLLKAQRKKLQDEVVRATDIKNDLFPNNKLQERTAHFSSFVTGHGLVYFTAKLKEALSTAKNGLSVIQI